eukprot:GHVR01007833.1.p2 GENE.GHVR01007833.1~~GHVR01007833.1.p2  ORF type:complete len:234 (-),score=65.35 GHVR01007833.1:98-799(-)
MKSKVAELYVAIMRVIYLTTWDSAVRDICDRSCVGLESFRFFLRVLNEIDTQVSCEDICRTQAERQQNTLLKDRMRCGDMCRLVECCRALLVSSHLLQHNKSLFIDTLAELSKFVSWMDMSLVSNEMFISSLWGLVSVDGVCVCVCACLCVGVSVSVETVVVVSVLQQMECWKECSKRFPCVCFIVCVCVCVCVSSKMFLLAVTLKMYTRILVYSKWNSIVNVNAKATRTALL